MKPWIWLITAFVLFAVANAADYFYQADMHGWVNPLWENGVRAAKWGFWDFIPHDPWHIAQWLRNFGLLLGAPFGVAAIARWLNPKFRPFRWYQQAIRMVAMLALYALTRGLTFSLLYKVLN